MGDGISGQRATAICADMYGDMRGAADFIFRAVFLEIFNRRNFLFGERVSEALRTVVFPP